MCGVADAMFIVDEKRLTTLGFCTNYIIVSTVRHKQAYDQYFAALCEGFPPPKVGCATPLNLLNITRNHRRCAVLGMILGLSCVA